MGAKKRPATEVAGRSQTHYRQLLRRHSGLFAGRARKSALEDARVGEALLGGGPAVLRVRLVEGDELGTDLGAVTGGGEDADLLDERLRVGLQVRGLAVGQVAHVGESAVGERDEVFVLTEHAERAAGSLAGAD